MATTGKVTKICDECGKEIEGIPRYSERYELVRNGHIYQIERRIVGIQRLDTTPAFDLCEDCGVKMLSDTKDASYKKLSTIIKEQDELIKERTKVTKDPLSG